MPKQRFFIGTWGIFIGLGVIAPVMVFGLGPEASALEYSPPYCTVKKGDTLASIATAAGLSVNDIGKWNRVQPRSLKIGQRLILAEPRITKAAATGKGRETAQTGESPDSRDVRPGGPPTESDGGRDCRSGCLGKWSGADERSLFVRVAKGFLDAPYRLGGSSVIGLDCSAFAKKVYGFFDIDLPRTAREQSRVGKQVSRDGLKEGDLVFFKSRRAIGHVGIYIGNHQFVHASSGEEKKVRIDTLEKPFYSSHFAKAVRIKELDDEL